MGRIRTRTLTKPVRIGIVGCGNVLSAYWDAAEKLRWRGLIEVVAACGREAQRDLVLNQLGVSRFTTDYRELVQAKDLDLVLVLTSMKEHGPITLPRGTYRVWQQREYSPEAIRIVMD